jgi:hypothetical protein
MTGESKTTKSSWYVSYPTMGRKTNRTTETFQTEDEAKAFTLQKLDQGFVPSAGTVNPHKPKRTIAPSDMAAWACPEQ